jgi:hypothetical protein
MGSFQQNSRRDRRDAFWCVPHQILSTTSPRRFLQDRPRRRFALDAVLALVLQDVVASESRSHVTAAESPQTTAGDCRSRFAYGVLPTL